MNSEKNNPISGGPAPFGFKREKNELVPDPEEAPVRKLMFELFLQHKRKKTVARLLNETGYRTRRGKLFSDTAIERLLTDPIAKEAIVSEEIWNQCNQILTEQKKSRKKTSRRPARHFFTGSVFCGCGGKMYVPSENRKYICQKCRNKISADDLEFIYCSGLKNFIVSREYLSACFYQSDNVFQDKTEQLGLLKKERKDTRQEIDRLYNLHMKGHISEKGFGNKYALLEKRADQLEKEISELEGELENSGAENDFSEFKMSGETGLDFFWPSLSSDEKIQLVELITDRIIVNDPEVNITFRSLSF